jgi:hypothetical protein
MINYTKKQFGIRLFLASLCLIFLASDAKALVCVEQNDNACYSWFTEGTVNYPNGTSTTTLTRQDGSTINPITIDSYKEFCTGAATTSDFADCTAWSSRSESTPTGGAGDDATTIISLENPLGSGRTNILTIAGDAIATVMTVLGSLTLFVFFWGAWNWLMSAGAPEKIEKGTKTMLYAVMGLFIIFAAYGMLKGVISVLTTG